MTLTLHETQVHSNDVMQWWNCSSLVSAPLRAEGGCETCERIVLLLVFIRNNNMATNLQGSLHVAGSRRFASCDCWMQTSWQVMQRVSHCWQRKTTYIYTVWKEASVNL